MEPGLAAYDGSARVMVDTNVWVDCLDEGSAWHDWSVEQLQSCSEKAPLHVNIVIYTELLVPQPDVRVLGAMRDVYDTLRSPLPWSCALLAARHFAQRESMSLGEAVSVLVRQGARQPIASGQDAVVPLRGRFALLPVRDEIVTTAYIRDLMDREGI